MKLAIMQPYFLPYIGYFQLMAAVDKFVVFDDVNFIKGGWVNRNRLLLNGAPHTFNVPLRDASQNRRIFEIVLADQPGWRKNLQRTVRQAYVRAPCYSQVLALFDRVINYPALALEEFLRNSLREVTRYLSLDVKMVESSRVYRNAHLKGPQRILDICKQEGADTYINPIGGVGLYDRPTFLEAGVQLYFLQSRPLTYSQGRSQHVPWLSILDVLMFNEPEVVRRFLAERDLV